MRPLRGLFFGAVARARHENHAMPMTDLRGDKESGGAGIGGPITSCFDGAEVEWDAVWIRVRMDRLPEGIRSGWKLHIASVPSQMESMLCAALPVLHSSDVAFKVIRSVERLEEMNDGRYGLMQAGKAVTVYPGGEAEALAIAEALRDVLKPFTGPAIPSDLRFADDAPIYFRFGPFDGRFVIDATGQKRRLLEHPELGGVPDLTSGGGAPQPEPAVLPKGVPYDHLAFLRGRFFFASTLQLTAKGGAFLAIDQEARGRGLLFVKTAKGGTNSDRYGRDAVWALRREHALLRRLGDVPGLPEPGELLSDGDEVAALVRGYIAGGTFWDLWTAANGRSAAMRRRLRGLLSQVFDTVRAIHARGVVVRDLSPANLLLAEREDGGPAAYVLDLELAHVLSEECSGYRRGTAGFYDPCVPRFRRPDAGEDHYALLALALMAHTGVHPAWLPAGLAEWVAGRIAAPRAEGFGTAWQAAFASLSDGPHFEAGYSGVLERIGQPVAQADIPRTSAEALLEAFRQQFSDWLDLHADFEDPDQANVYSGLSGLVLVAIETGQLDLLAEAALRDSLGRLVEAGEKVAHIPGLYFGASGIGLALAAAGRFLDDGSLRRKASLVDKLVDPRAPDVPDVCQGLAGYVLSHCALHRLGEEGALARASEAGGRLLTLAERPELGQAAWAWPEGVDGALAATRHFGFAHGVAGVAYALLRLYEANRESAFLEAAEEGLGYLRTQARPVPEVEDALWWAASASDDTCWNAWCHGTPGIVKAFAAALRVRASEEDRDLLERALRGVFAANNGGYCLCHGVASRLDAYADARGVVSEGMGAVLLAQAERDAALLSSLDLASLEQGRRPGLAGEEAGGLMTGALGVSRTLLRWRGRLAGPFGELLP